MNFAVCPEDGSHLQVAERPTAGIPPILACPVCGKRFALGSQGPIPELPETWVLMPMVLGMHREVAEAVLRAAITDAEILISHGDAPPPVEGVIAQRPPPGARVPPWCQVILTVPGGSPGR
jgi:hypothetical protein